MNDRLELRDRMRFAYQRAKGVPIESDLRPYQAVARQARSFDFRSLSDELIEERARALRAGLCAAPRAAADPDALPLCLALAAEACRRSLGLEPYEEQLVAAAAMCRGRVAQMQTGEGKTLAAAFAASFGALRGGGFLVVTANDYLARRDAEWMRPIYERLGLSVASISGRSSRSERLDAYLADVCYLTARELGFDYLRDGLAYYKEDIVQRPFSAAIVDEADFVLIDEARVPLVIAGRTKGDGVDLREVDAFARSLTEGADYELDPEGRRVLLTLEGQTKLEAFVGDAQGEPQADPQSEERLSLVKARLFAALHARRLLARDVDYVVKRGEVKLVDAFTGRVAERRQWPWGIQAALEAKEALEIGPEGKIFGSIAVQHLMALFPRLAAMTATAVPAAAEFAAAYGMGTVVIPPVRPSVRIDLPDVVFWTKDAKRRALVTEIAKEHASGRPVLVGTGSVRESEDLAEALAAEGLDCVVLNAKNDEEEAALIARAGSLGAITISTNMAGRGTDIRLGAEPQHGTGPSIAELGGLLVIGTNRHETRRVDDQLRGRAGRQGEPGASRFFLSLEDGLFERYGVRDFLPEPYRYGPYPEDDLESPIDDAVVRKEIARAQSIIEGQNSRIRRSLRKFSLIVEYDRRFLRELRDEALASGALPAAVESALASARGATAASRDAMTSSRDAMASSRDAMASSRDAMIRAFLARLDQTWADHLAVIEDFKEGMGLQRIAGKDPGIEYVGVVGDAFDAAIRGLESSAIEDCRAILAGAEAEAVPRAPDRPSSTWTYVVEDDLGLDVDLGLVFETSVQAMGPLAPLLSFAMRAASGLTRKKRPFSL